MSEKYPPTVGELIEVLSQLDPESSVMMRTPVDGGPRVDWDICGVFLEGAAADGSCGTVILADYGLGDGTDLLSPTGCDAVGSDTPEQDRARMLLKFKTRERF